MVITASLSLADMPGTVRLWQQRKVEFTLSIAAFLGVALLGVLPGIAIAVGLSILNVFRRAWRPYQTVLGRVDGLAGYHDVRSYPDAEQLPGPGDLPVRRAAVLRQRQDVPRRGPARWPAPSRRRGGSSSPPSRSPTWTPPRADMLVDLDQLLDERGQNLVFAELKDPVRRKIERYGLTGAIEPRHFFPTVEAAVDAFRAETGAVCGRLPMRRLQHHGWRPEHHAPTAGCRDPGNGRPRPAGEACAVLAVDGPCLTMGRADVRYLLRGGGLERASVAIVASVVDQLRRDSSVSGDGRGDRRRERGQRPTATPRPAATRDHLWQAAAVTGVQRTDGHRTAAVGSYKGHSMHAAPGVHEYAVELARATLPDGGRILEIGAGCGALAVRMQDAGFDVVPTDLDPPHDWIHRLDLDAPEWTDDTRGPFDLVVCVETLEHVENPRQALRAIRSLLRAGDRVLVSTPNITHPHSRLKMFLRGSPVFFGPNFYYDPGTCRCSPTGCSPSTCGWPASSR